MEFNVTNSNNIFDKVCTSKFVTFVSDIHELLPFDCLNFNEMVPTEPLLGKE